jgi:hypothetical protein
MKRNSDRTTNLDMVLSLIRELPDQQNILIVPRIFVRMTGSINAALLLSQILYWSDKSSNGLYRRKLVFAKTTLEFADELGLGQKAFENARATLEALGLIRTTIGGFRGKKTVHWHPEMETITKQIQSVASACEPEEESTDQDEAFLAGFLGNSPSANFPEKEARDCQNGEMISSHSSNQESSKNRSEKGAEAHSNMPETAVSNTYTTPHITTDTTNRQNAQMVVDGNEGKNPIHTYGNPDAFKCEWIAYMQSLSPEMKIENFDCLTEAFLSAFAEYPELSKTEIQLLLAFAVLTGFTNFQKTDLRDGKTRTIVERWIEPVREWAQRNVTAEEIRAAIRGAKKDGMHPKLQCPASYSPRVLGAGQSAAAPSTNLYDDEA